MRKKLTKLEQIVEALSEPGAELLLDERAIGRHKAGWFVRKADGSLIRCTGVADRLTWAKAKRRCEFVGRERSGLVLVYRPTW